MTTYLEECNVKLSWVKAALKIYVRNNKLYLRGTLPVRESFCPNNGTSPSNTPGRKQYKLSSGLSNSQAHVKYLYNLSLEVTRKLNKGSFTWQWLDTTLQSLSQSSRPQQKPNTLKSLGNETEHKQRLPIQDSLSFYHQQDPLLYQPILIPQVNQILESLYYQRVILKGIKERTWQLEYLKPIEELKGLAISTNQHISPYLIQSSLYSLPKDSRKRKRYHAAYSLLLRELNINYSLDNLHSTYSYTSVLSQSLPSDEQIVEVATYIKRKDRQWYGAYCYLATYGLRNTELLAMDYSSYPNLFVKYSKTGRGRYVLPFHQQWVDQFALSPKITLPSINRKDEYSFSHAITTKFRKWGLSFRPKALRHAYARRMAELNYPTVYAARLMGHSLKVHESTYMNFIGLESYELARQQYMPATER